VELRRPRGETALAWSAATVGTIGIASALTPELADSVDLVHALLPPGLPGAARIAALAFGLALVWLSRSLARRRRRAWQLAVALVVGISIAHLAKGLDVEEAVLSLLLLAALVRFRARFDVPGDPSSVRPLLGTALALAALASLALALELHGFEAGRLETLMAGLSLVLGFRALQLWLRPFTERVRQSAEDRRVVRELVRTHGVDSLAFFSLRRDKSYFFSPSRRSFLAYRVVGGSALVSGDPIGEADEVVELLAEFRRVCRARGWRLALLSVRGEFLPFARRLGLRAIRIGEEAVVRPGSFSLEGRPIRKVRQSVARAERAGYRFRVVKAGAIGSRLRAELEQVSNDWRGSHVERGFSMAMDDLFGEPETLFAIAQREDRVGAFLHLVPCVHGYSLGAMRRCSDTPNGLMESLIARLICWARDQGTSEISLNFCVFADLLADTCAGPLEASARMLLRAGDRLFQLERLLVFSRKFGPEWRPRYLCVESLGDLPLVGVAYLRAESLLTPPGPWARRARVKV
jgi:lysylphosphatidylglycerol synthetase-like protein (DUF2156 family)